jgi:hypothetical protein
VKYLFKTWWGRLFILIQTTSLAVSIYLVVTFLINSHKEEEGEISAIMSAEDSSKFFGEKIPPPGEQNRFDIAIEEVKNKQSRARQKIPIFYLLSNLSVPAVWCIGLFICKGLPARTEKQKRVCS